MDSSPSNVLGKLIFLVLLMLQAAQVYAWTYEEHRQIVQDAFEVICADSSNGTTAQRAICESPLIRICYGHMVAIAGDHAASPEELIEPGIRHDLLRREKSGLSCRNLSFSSVLDGAVLEKLKSIDSMAKSGLRGWWTWVSYLPNNEAHFQPTARMRWYDHMDNMQQVDRRRLQSVLAHSAFASHFLQDSFAAGHSGINRGERRQDYDQAFHDDVNGHGTFFRNSNLDQWHSYGDEHLNDQSVFLTADYCSNGDRSNEIDGELETLLSARVKELDPRAIRNFCNERGLKVLTLWPLDMGLGRKCFYMDNCDKLELIYTGDADARAMVGECAPSASGVIRGCLTSKEYVGQVMQLQIRALIGYLDGKPINTLRSEIDELIPIEYRAIEYGEGTDLFINKRSFAMTYSGWTSLDNAEAYVVPSFRNWTIGVYRANSNLSTLEDTTFSWSLMQKVSDWAGAEKLPKVIRDKGRMGLRFDIVSNDGAFLDGIEVNYGLELLRPLHRVLGVEAIAAVGLDDVWGGRVDRTWYYGGGLELNFHIGKNVLFLDVLSLSHNGSKIDDVSSIRAIIGWRVASLSLSR